MIMIERSHACNSSKLPSTAHSIPVAPRLERPDRGRAQSLWPAGIAGLVFLVVLAKLAINMWAGPCDLVADEAYYWLQGQHLDWSYNEKGPLLPWLIAGCCRVFGDVEWAVRLPVIVCGGLAAWGVGWLGLSASGGNRTVAAMSVLLFLLCPAFQVNAQISTQDGVMVALWIALTAVGLRLVRRWRQGASTWGPWVLLWALVGVGVLLKQSVLTFLPSLAVFWFLFRNELPLRKELFAQQVVGFAICAALCSPILFWNAGHGWPTLAHTLGHLGLGGDQTGQARKGNPLIWELRTIGGFLGAIGPVVILMIWSLWRNRQDHRRTELGFDVTWLIAASWTTTVFYFVLSLFKPVVPSWPLPNMAPMVIPAAMILTSWPLEPAATRHATRVRRAVVAYGVASAIILSFPALLLELPGAQSILHKRMFAEIRGGRERAGELASVIVAETHDGPTPLVVAPNYGAAALASFYLPGHPAVASRDRFLTGRRSTLDQWPETNLSNPRHLGRTLILVQDHRNDPNWMDVLICDQVRSSDYPDYLVATNFQGLRQDCDGSAGARGASPCQSH